MTAIRNIETADEAALVQLAAGLRSAVRKGAGVPLSAWETTCVQYVEAVTGDELLVPESLGSLAEKAQRHAARHQESGKFIPAQSAPDATVGFPWRNGGASLIPAGRSTT